MNQSLADQFTSEVHLRLLRDASFKDMAIEHFYRHLLEDTVIELAPTDLCFVQFWDGQKTVAKLVVDYGIMPGQLCHENNLLYLDNLADVVRQTIAVLHVRVEGADGAWEVSWEGDRRLLHYVGGVA